MSHTVIGRRRALQTLFGAGLIACPICRALAEDHKPHWTYEGAEGPTEWGGLSADFKTCQIGLQQSPIDLTASVTAKLGGIESSFPTMPLTILNNGHTIQVVCPPGGHSIISGDRFELVQFHFHHPSEHLLAGKPFDMELHFVHKSAAGKLAVLGVFIRQGAENPALVPIWAAFPAKAGDAVEVGTTIDPAALLPKSLAYFRYSGSLTTPPCSEGVRWTVFEQPIEASREQIQRFAALFKLDARPAQPLNNRHLMKSS